MEPEIQEKLDELEGKFDELSEKYETLQEEYDNHRHSGLDSVQIDGTSLKETPFAKVTAPTDAGATYSQGVAQTAVDAINAIISILETTKITSDQ